MDRNRRVGIGKASKLSFGSPALAVRPHMRRASEDATRKQTLAAAIVAVGIVATMALAVCYWTMWRSVDITVGGEERSVRVGTPVAKLLEDNDYFGAVPGRLLSVGGNVIDEQGGERCSVTLGDTAVASDQLATTKLGDGDVLTVSNGADVTEPYQESSVPLAPGVQMDGTGAIQYVSQWGTPGTKTVRTGERSGETVDQEITAPATDMVVSARNARPQGDKKYIALTFDDGPSGYTPDILQVLKDKGVQATFYNLGSQEDKYGQYAKQLLDEGHELASHTNQHMYLPDLDNDSLRAEISSAADSINGASGQSPRMIRAPYGAFTANDWGRAGDLISCNVLWNIDTLDWKRPGAGVITNEVLSNAYNGAIVLMHDGGGNRSQDVEALPGIIDGLRANGYELVTVSELMRLDGSFPQEVIDGTVSMPDGAALPLA